MDYMGNVKKQQAVCFANSPYVQQKGKLPRRE